MSFITPSSGWEKPDAPQPQVVYVQAPQSKDGCFSYLIKVLGTIVLGFIALVVVVAIIKSVSSTNKTESTSAEPAVNASEDGSATKRPTLKIFQPGETVKVGYWSYQVQGVTWTPFVGNGMMQSDRADVAFMLIDIAIENNDQTPSMIPLHKLIDTQGREYETSSKGIFIPDAFSGFEKLNPDVGKQGRFVFDVPPNRKYVLWVSGGIQSNAAALIDIPLPQTRQPAPRPQEQPLDIQPHQEPQ